MILIIRSLHSQPLTPHLALPCLGQPPRLRRQPRSPAHATPHVLGALPLRHQGGLQGRLQGCHLPPHRGHSQDLPPPGLQSGDVRLLLPLLRSGDGDGAPRHALSARD